MKYIFLVQGEGRGHMTQAIELSKILAKHGHEVVHTFIGKSKRREVPQYFYDQIKSKVTELNSPNFVLDKNNKSLNLWKSISFNSRYLSKYKSSLNLINEKVKATKPHVIINFYDFLGGFYFRFYRPSGVKHVCIGRQFLTMHPEYIFEPKREIEKKLYLLNNKITSQRCDKYLALSFRPYDPIRFKKMVTVPPLLKEETKALKTSVDDFILGYMVNDGYAEEIMEWHEQHQEQVIHCFWDRKDKPKEFKPHVNLTFHQIDNKLFVDFMSKCKGYVSTAGFESICEAMYMQKPVLMIPVEGQYEQACNAIDAEISGAGRKATHFDISLLLEFAKKYDPPIAFRSWVEKTESVFIDELTNF